jgi:pimeloyl-ACP methyl ester carboxylesterase
MSRDFLLFSHANGFPAACYRKFFGSLESDFRISAIDCIGHDPAYPVTDGWPHLVAQLIDHVSTHCRVPVVGVGHSLGGYLTFMAAVQRPELFKCIILLDAPILGYFKGTAFGMLKRLGLADRITPAHGTRARRRDWPSAESGRVRLLFDPEIEYRIYRSFPHDLVYYCNRLRLPAGFIGGRHSHELQQVGLAHTRRSFRVKRIEGGHLFPFERPQAAAEAVRQLAAELLAG